MLFEKSECVSEDLPSWKRLPIGCIDENGWIEILKKNDKTSARMPVTAIRA